MKFRKGFVSNSSSSSFVCEICGGEWSGQDGEYGGIEELRCENGHILCSDCANWERPEENEWDDEIPPAACKICSFKQLLDKDAVDYMTRVKETFTSREDILNTLQLSFDTYKEFQDWIEEKHNENT